jgi:hypothetical protein
VKLGAEHKAAAAQIAPAKDIASRVNFTFPSRDMTIAPPLLTIAGAACR